MVDSTRGRQMRSQTIVVNTQPDSNPSSAAPATSAAQRLAELQIQNQIEELEHQQRMRQKAEEKADEEIRALRRTNNSTPGEGDDEPIGERFSLQVLEVVQQVSGVSPKEIHLILQHKFEAENLTRLRNDVGTRPREDSQTAEFDPATRQLTVKRVRGLIKDFGDNAL
ncbi:hypothetical protein K469DRAFT_708479, partial [Zopfia rhizophila CBS 207.26]